MRIHYELNLAKNAKQNKKSFYQYISSKTHGKVIRSIEDEDGALVEDDRSKAQVLNHYFSSIFHSTDQKRNRQTTLMVDENSISDIQFTSEEVNSAIHNLKWNSTSGPDEISTTFLKHVSSSLIEPLKALFQQSLNLGIVPICWKDANVTPIYKKGSKIKANNYRPISLTSNICKLMEAIIKRHIYDFMQISEIIPSNQHGFLPRRSCATNLIQFFNQVTDAVNKRIPVDVIYFDVRKAFDLVPHDKLLEKLYHFGIQGNLWKWIKDWLSGRRQRVVLNGEFSGWKGVGSGVIQGSVLGPLLFLLYVSDLPKTIRAP